MSSGAAAWLDVRLDPPLPDRKPLARGDLRQRHIAVGPVAVFGASNFPLAFSVAGGDTASALAAGCPVVVKAHSAHPGTSELVGRAVQAAVAECGLPEGVFSMLFGSGSRVGTALVAHPHIKSVGFTGSRRGGTALMKVAAERREPIPVYAEMSSINPVFLMPAALAARAEKIGAGFVASQTMGAGQFCTNPGLVLALDSPDLDRFLASAAATLRGSPAATMLTPGIHSAYQSGVERLAGNSKVREVARGQTCQGPHQCQAALFQTDAASFLADPDLEEEIFGSSALVVRCPDVQTLRDVAEHLEGQLTATVHMEDADLETVRAPAADAGAAGRAHPGQRLADRRRGRACHGPWRTVSGHFRQPHARRWARWRSGASCAPSATRTCRRRCCRKPYAMAIPGTCPGWSTANRNRRRHIDPAGSSAKPRRRNRRIPVISNQGADDMKLEILMTQPCRVSWSSYPHSRSGSHFCYEDTAINMVIES